MPFGANGAPKVDQFVTPALAAKLLRLGHRTHSLVEPQEHPVTPSDISGDKWWPERIIKLTRWPSGDVGITVVDRKARPARVVAPKRQTGTLSEDDSQRATRRARRRIWKGCQELEANCMLTIAKRGGFQTIDEAWAVTGEIVTEMKRRGWIVGHLTVPEIHDGSRTDGMRQGANLGTWHMHVATRRPGFFDFHEMHQMVRTIEARVFGNDPWQADQRLISVNVGKRPQGKRFTPASLARYLAPYAAKSIEDAPRDLHRKRFDISRKREKPQEVTIRCQPSETSSPEEVANQLLHRLAPHRQFTTPFQQEVCGVKFWQQSAIDWGGREVPPEAFDLPSVGVLWALIPKPHDQQPCDSEQTRDKPGAERAMQWAAQLQAERRNGSTRAKPDRVGVRERAAVGGCPGPRPSPEATQAPAPTPLADIITPWLDQMRREHPESSQP
jgi:hypothetical protein